MPFKHALDVLILLYHHASFFFVWQTWQVSKQHKLTLKKKGKKKIQMHPVHLHHIQSILTARQQWKFMAISCEKTGISDSTIWHDAGKWNGETVKPNVRCVQGIILHIHAKPECTEGEACLHSQLRQKSENIIQQDFIQG